MRYRAEEIPLPDLVHADVVLPAHQRAAAEEVGLDHRRQEAGLAVALVDQRAGALELVGGQRLQVAVLGPALAGRGELRIALVAGRGAVELLLALAAERRQA